jgi:hypothetical protein
LTRYLSGSPETIPGAEIDPIIEKNSKERYAIEIKRSHAPSVSKGITAIPILDMMNELTDRK